MGLSEKIQLYPFPVYPLLFGLYPVLYLWSANRIQQPAYVIIPSLLFTLVMLLIVYLVAVLILKNVQRAALATAALSFVTLSYGHLMTLTRQWNLGLQNRFMLPVAGIFLLVLWVLILATRPDYRPLTKTLNLVMALLVTFPTLPASTYYLSASQRDAAKTTPVSSAAAIAKTTISNPRDVYFILLDNYGRQDHLLEHEKFDNSQLVAELKKRGFIFPDCAQGNYPGTVPVMASILNMQYLDQLKVDEDDFMSDERYDVLAPLIKDSLVLRQFRSYGYQVVTFRGFLDVIDIQNSDQYINFDRDAAYHNRLETLSFQDLYLQTTILHPINEYLQFYPEWLTANGPRFLAPYLPRDELVPERFLKVFEQNIYAFDALEHIPKNVPSPKFVYAHVYSAHWPFMLRPDGTLRVPFTEDISLEGYLDGVRYTNNRIINAIDAILASSAVEPVIILQGDHANGSEEGLDWSGQDRLQILSAYYLPGSGNRPLPDTISPVNNFRLVFKNYFSEPIELLPDVNYYLDKTSKKLEIAPKSCISTQDHK